MLQERICGVAPRSRDRGDVQRQRRAREFDGLPDRIIVMKKPDRARKLDQTRVLNASDLQAIAGGASSLPRGATSEVMNNPLYVGSEAEGTNPLYV